MSAQSPTPQPAIVRSMTGFARVRASFPGFDVIVSVKSVNHRSLDLHFQTSSDLDAIEPDLRTVLRRRLVRGHVDVRVVVSRTAAAAAMAINRSLLGAYLAAYRAAANEFSISAEPDLNAAFRMPGVLGDPGETELPADVRQAVVSTLERAVDELDAFRSREGAEIVTAMLRHNSGIRQASAELVEIRSRALPLFQARLNERVKELLKGVNVDPQRLAQEAALLADRSDIAEEIARLQIHAGQLEQLLVGGGEVGKKLDFLLQEMNREANTMLSKTSGIGEAGLRITELALSAKADIEKIREQSLNLE